MASYETAFVREYVQTFLEQLAIEAEFTEDALQDMRNELCWLPDVISALENSDLSTLAKENPHDAFFSIVGTTCDGDAVRVTVSINPYTQGVCVHHIQRQ